MTEMGWATGAYGDAGVTEMGYAMGSIYSGNSGGERSHTIFYDFISYLISLLYSKYTIYLSNFWSHWLLPRLCGSTRLSSIISSHPVPVLFKPELLFLTNSSCIPQEVWWSVEDELSAFKLCCFTTGSMIFGLLRKIIVK